MEPVPDLLGHPTEDAGLGVIEAGALDEALHVRGGRAREGVRVGVPGEQAGTSDVRRLVAGSLGEDRSDQHLERILRMVPEVRYSPVPGMVEVAQSVEEGVPRKVASAHVRPPGRLGGVSTPGSERSGSSSPVARISSPMR